MDRLWWSGAPTYYCWFVVERCSHICGISCDGALLSHWMIYSLVIYVIGDQISDLLSEILWLGMSVIQILCVLVFTIRACGALDVIMDSMIWVSLGCLDWFPLSLLTM